MTTLPAEPVILLCAALFLVGLVGVLVRRNLVFVLMSIEIMLNAAGLVVVLAGARWRQADGQVVFLFVLSVAATEVAAGLGLLLAFRRRLHTLDANAASTMKG